MKRPLSSKHWTHRRFFMGVILQNFNLGGTDMSTTRPLIVLWPKDLQHRYQISPQTLYRWERTGRVPRRDVRIGGVASGWYRSTIEQAESGQAA